VDNVYNLQAWKIGKWGHRCAFNTSFIHIYRWKCKRISASEESSQFTGIKETHYWYYFLGGCQVHGKSILAVRQTILLFTFETVKLTARSAKVRPWQQFMVANYSGEECNMELQQLQILDYTKNTNVMHLILFICQIFSSTCFEYQVLILRRI